MSDNFWKKVDYVFGLIPVMAIFCLLVISANIEIKDLDLWLHIAVGRFITLHQYVPDVDILSATIAGAPWNNHEWLFQVIVFNIFNTWGAQGLIFMQVMVVSLTMLLLYFLGYNRDKQLVTTVFLFLVYMVYQQRFTIRPDLFSLLFFTIYIFALSLHIDKRWTLPLLIAVQVVWSNMHGFFFFGPLFVMLGLLSEFLKRHVRLPYEWNSSGRLTDEEYSRLVKTLVFVLLACLINPAFVQGALYPLGVFFSLAGENKIFFENIQELKAPVTWGNLFDAEHYLYYKMTIFLSFVSFVLNRRRIDISALLFWLVFLVFSLKAVRNAPFFAFAAYMVFVNNVFNISYDEIIPVKFTRPKFLYLTSIVLKLLFVIWTINFYEKISMRSYYDFDKYELKSEYGGISQRSYPDKAVDFLVNNQVRGNFFNDFNSGAYLLGRAHPDIKVFIDGRTEVYGGAFFRQYQEIWDRGNAELFEKMVERHHLTGALLNSTRHHIPDKILKYLYQHKDWHVVYFDYDAVVFLKDTEVNRDLIDRFKIDLAQRQTKPTDLYRLGALRVQPFQPYYRAYTLESLDLDGPALRELDDAFKIDPLYVDAHDLAGKIYAKQKDFHRAFEHFRIALSAGPRTKERRYNFALAYLDLGQFKQSAQQYLGIVKSWPRDPKGHFFLAKAYILDGQYPQAVASIQTAHQLSPEDVMDLLDLGDLLFEHQAYPQAGEIYTLGLKTGKEAAALHTKLGRVALALNDPQKARTEFERALSLEPGNKEIQKALEAIQQGL